MRNQRDNAIGRLRATTKLLRAPAKQTELEAQLLEAVDSFEAGRGVNGEMAFRRLRKRIEEALENTMHLKRR